MRVELDSHWFGMPCRSPDRRSGRGRRAGWHLLVLVAVLVTVTASGQELDEDDEEGVEAKIKVPLTLLEREPFDQLTVRSEDGQVVLEIVPLESVPANPRPTDRLRVRLLSDPEQWYEVAWQHIVSVRTYPQMVFEDAQKLVEGKNYIEAFRNFDYLLNTVPAQPGLKTAVLEYLLGNAAQMVSEGQFDHALAVLEEVVRRDAGYRRAEVATRMAEVADRLLGDAVQREDYGRARGMIARLDSQYGAANIASLARWRRQLIDQASDLQVQAKEKLSQGEFREAERLTRRMHTIWPDLPGSAELRESLAVQYPMVFVGVTEAARRQDSTSIDSWGARRTGRLTQRTLLEFIGAGPEGGQYLCAFGDYYQSDDRRRLSLQLHTSDEDESVPRLTGYDVARQVLDMADPRSKDYEPLWAALVLSVRVEDVFKVHMDLRRPHVLPEALLQVQLHRREEGTSAPLEISEGPFVPADVTEQLTHFVRNQRYAVTEDAVPAEIVERYFLSSEAAVAALRRGEIDVVDCVLPDMAIRLRNDESLRVVPYSLPTIHLLVPNARRPRMSSATFRRAVACAINRQSILQSELVGNSNVPGCQVVSGPFPVGTRSNDPLAYAYNTRVPSVAFDPRLASILMTLARRELVESAKRRGETLSIDAPVVIAYPANEAARMACQAISQYLQVIGLETELRELPPGVTTDADGEADLLYVQAAMWEPVIDARRLLGGLGMGDVTNEYVAMALRRLDTARNWREARERLHELHRIVHEQMAVIPLWQTVNHLVHSRRLNGVGAGPLTLYQDVEQWRIAR